MTSRNILLTNSQNFQSDFRNKLINGDFMIWQRNGGTATTASGYHADRWNSQHGGSSKTHSLQGFTIGQTDVPGNPWYFSRTVVTSVAGAGNFVLNQQPIEFVTLLSGKKITLTFWAKADAVRNIATEFYQYFGSGGSATIQGIGATQHTLTTIWQKFNVVVDIPSIVGKTLGAGYGFTALRFWFDAGSTYNAFTGSLGQQSGTFDIAHVSVVEGDATGEIDPFTSRNYGQELALCQRFFEVGNTNYNAYAQIGNNTGAYQPFKVTKRATPVIGIVTANYAGCSGANAAATNTEGMSMRATTTGTGQIAYDVSWTADAEL